MNSTDRPHAAYAEYAQNDLQNTVTIIGDIVEPAVPEHWWESLGRRRRRPIPSEAAPQPRGS